MTVRSRHNTLLSDKRWDKAFGRQATVESVLAYVVSHWYTLQKRPPADMLFAEREPKITRYFGQSLNGNAKANGIFGLFIPEHTVAYIDEVRQVLESRGRTDITYFTEKLVDELQFVMEFKKLKTGQGGNTSRRAYCADGVLRFVEGVYARDCDLGFMVGLIELAGDASDTVNGLKRAIQQPDMSRQLKAIENPHGSTTVTAKNLVFNACEFETRHARDHISQPDVLLGHIVLSHQPE